MEERLLLASTWTVINTLDDANPGSLRWAIGQANAGAGGDTIDFKIPGGGIHTISVGSALPAINLPTTLDATQQPGYSGQPLVALDGTGAGAVDGLAIVADNTTVLGLAIGKFQHNGIIISGNHAVVQGDYIGIDAGGTVVQPNGGAGILITNGGNDVIGGSGTSQGNVVSGNTTYGIQIVGTLPATSNVVVQGNFVGTDASGTLRRGNLSGGIQVFTSLGTTIGGTNPGEGNVISANGFAGISTFGTTDGLVIEGNAIGTDVTRTANLGNVTQGISVFSSNNTIGGPTAAAGNLIAFNGAGNGGAGIQLLVNSANVAILTNSIFSNGGLGIELSGSSNNQQVAPTLSAASSNATSTTIVGTINALANTTYTIQFFSDPIADPSGFGEGQVFLGQTTVTTGAGGGAAINVTLPVAVAPGDVVTSTATDPNNNTSQFSNDVMNLGTADMAVTLTASPASPSVGDQVTYSLTVVNNGPTVARGVTVTDLLPGNTTFVSTTTTQGSFVAGSNSISYAIGTMNASASVLITIVVQTTAASSPSITDSATVGSQEGDPDASNNTQSLTTTISPVADLSLAIQDSPDPVLVGQNVTYTLTVANAGPSAATGVTLTDTLPTGATFVSASSTQGTTAVAAGVLTNDIGTLPAGATPVVLTIVVTANAANAPLMSDSAIVSAVESDPTPANDVASASTTVTPVADLVVTVSDAPDPVQVGQVLTYTVTLTNSGPSAATGIALVDTLPANVTFISASDDAAGTPTFAAGKVTDNLATLAAGGTVKLTITVAPTTTTAATITDTVTAVGNEIDSDPTTNSASTTTAVDQVADVSVSATASPNPVEVGQPLTYTLTVTNNGPSTATGVTLTDTLPAGLGFVSASSSQGTTGQSAGTVTASLGTLASGATATVTIIATPSATAAATVTDTASVLANEVDLVPANNAASVSTTITPSADLAVSAAGPASAVLLGQNVTFTVTATNNGPSPATGVTLTDTLPAGSTFVSASDSLGNNPVPVGSTLTDSLGALAANASVTLTIVVRPGAPGQSVDTASVAGNEHDDVPTNNTAVASATIAPVADLEVSMIADQAQVTTGHNLAFTVTVVNRGPSPATGVTLTDTLPAGATFVSAAAGGAGVSQSGGVVTASIGTLAPGASATLTVIVTPNTAGTASNTATATLNEVDPVPGDDTANLGVTVVEPPGTIQFAAAGFTVAENGGTGTIIVSRTVGAQGTVSVQFATIAGGTGVAGVDYTPVSGTLVFNQGETTKTISVPVLDNPNDNHDETVLLSLASPGGGALLGTQTTTTLTIQDIDPDLVAPTVQEVRLFGPATSIVDVALFFSEGLAPATATNLQNYLLVNVGADARFGTADDTFVAIAAAIYDAATRTVTLQPASPLSTNVFYYVRVAGVTDPAGNLANGGQYADYFARGTSLKYPDASGDQVQLQLTGPGLMDLTRFASGEGERLQVLNPQVRRTTLSGKVIGSGTTSFDSITGLGVFGQVHVKMTTPKFYVNHLPFDRTIFSPAAVDGVFAPVTVPVVPRRRVRARALPQHR